MSGLYNYLNITFLYWGFTITDGALRMIVLLHFYRIGYTPFTLALLFLFYELAGIFANLLGGWLSTKFGISRMLSAGILLQIFGLICISIVDYSWTELSAVLWILLAQGISGIAKDFTKTTSKSAIKIISVNNDSRLFYWVAWFTGSKNAVKGAGFFVGGILLELVGFQFALWGMAIGLGILLFFSLVFLPLDLGKGTPSSSILQLFSKTKNINILSTARIFMFGARDIFFVVGLPVFLYSNGWNFIQIGGALSLWTIGYGIIQGIVPYLIPQNKNNVKNILKTTKAWCWILTSIPLFTLLLLEIELFLINKTFIISGLIIFGVVFAINSSLHSYLILAFAGTKKVAENVGFYYAANASGRLVGTLLSGLLYQHNGLNACVVGSAVFLIICMIFTLFIINEI